MKENIFYSDTFFNKTGLTRVNTFVIAAWAEKLGSSSVLQHTLRNPPAFGSLSREREEPNGVTKPSAEPAPRELVRDLEDLVVQGIPTLLQRGAIAVDASSREEDRMGGAFEGGDQELSFLDDVTTAIPRVEVRAEMCLNRKRACGVGKAEIACNVFGMIMAVFRLDGRPALTFNFRVNSCVPRFYICIQYVCGLLFSFSQAPCSIPGYAITKTFT